MSRDTSSSKLTDFTLENKIHKLTVKLVLLIKDPRFIVLICCSFFGIIIKSIMFFWSVIVVDTFLALFGIPTHGVLVGVGNPLVLEHYDDWNWYYEIFAARFIQGYLPYTPELYEIVPGIQSYIYPPLLLYLLVGFYLIPGKYSVAFGIVFLDMVTGGCLYIITLRITHSIRRAGLAIILFFLNPIALWWTDFCWFAEAIFTCFMILGILCLFEDRLYFATLCLALACMIKQVAIIFVPIIFILAYHKELRVLLMSVTTFFLTVLILSLPYLIIMPFTYLSIIIGPAGPPLYIGLMPPWNVPVPLFASFWFLPLHVRNLIAFAIYTYIPLVFFMFTIYFTLLLTPEEALERHRYRLIPLCLLLSLTFFTFFPRGIFKWYAVAIVPFLALAIACIPSLKTNTTEPKNRTRQQQIIAKLDFKLILAVISYFLASLAFTLLHRWNGPGILLLCLIAYATYWIKSGRFGLFLTSNEHSTHQAKR